jgi:ATP-dependent DNA helicase RecQ
MSDTKKEDIYKYIEALEELGLIKTDFEVFGVLKITEKGYKTFMENEKVMVKLRQETESKKTKKNKVSKNEDNTLFEELKTLRTHIASKAFIPPYVVFSDMTLKDMCKKLPTTDNEFLEIAGVGKYKLEKYGKEFMDIIKKYK